MTSKPRHYRVDVLVAVASTRAYQLHYQSQRTFQWQFSQKIRVKNQRGGLRTPVIEFVGFLSRAKAIEPITLGPNLTRKML